MNSFLILAPLHYLGHVVDGECVAHCLDFDLVATGSSEDLALKRLNLLVRTQYLQALSQNDPKLLFRHAPKKYWSMYSDAALHGTTTSQLEIHPEHKPVQVHERNLTIVFAKATAAA